MVTLFRHLPGEMPRRRAVLCKVRVLAGGLAQKRRCAKYPLEGSYRFARLQPNSSYRDYSRLSCGIGDTHCRPRIGSTRSRLTARGFVYHSKFLDWLAGAVQ
jgi:hypothetical protein